MKMEPVTLATLAGGEVAEMFAHELERVLADIDDPNTEAETKRKITLDITFEPTRDREAAAVSINAKTKLAGLRPGATMVHLAHSGAKLVALARNPNQMDAFDDETTTRPTIINGGKK